MADAIDDRNASIKVGQRVCVGTYHGIVRYIGPLPDTHAVWVGIEWCNSSRGKHNGVYNGIKYFEAEHHSGSSFVRHENVRSCNVSFISALKNKYGREYCDPNADKKIAAFMNACKVQCIELVGMPEITKQQGCFRKLRHVSLCHCCITNAGAPEEIQNCCPNIIDLELCNNCITDWKTVSQITQQLPHLAILNLSANAIKLPQELIPQFETSFKSLKKIVLGKLNYSWRDFMVLCEAFPQLEILEVPDNNLDRLETPVKAISNLLQLNLEKNYLTWSEINKLRSLKKLELLNVNYNGIRDIQIAPSSFPSLKSLMISDNSLLHFESLCELNKLPKLNSLRIKNNPLLDGMTVNNYTLQIIGRIANLTKLNGTTLTNRERQNNERDFLNYLDIIWHKQLKNANERAEFLAKNPRYMELIASYGSDYSADLNPSSKIKTIQIKIVNYCKESKTEKDLVIKKLPITITLHRVRDIGNRLFNLGSKQIELSYITKEKPDVEYPMENMNQTLDYYSVEDGNTILIKW